MSIEADYARLLTRVQETEKMRKRYRILQKRLKEIYPIITRINRKFTCKEMIKYSIPGHKERDKKIVLKWLENMKRMKIRKYFN